MLKAERQRVVAVLLTTPAQRRPALAYGNALHESSGLLVESLSAAADCKARTSVNISSIENANPQYAPRAEEAFADVRKSRRIVNRQ